MLDINPEKVREIIDMARAFDAEDGDCDGDTPLDDGRIDIPEEDDDVAAFENLLDFIRALDEDEQETLVALAWVGRGTYGVAEWTQALEEAQRAHNARTAEYLTSLPLLGDYLEEGLSAVEEVEDDEEE